MKFAFILSLFMLSTLSMAAQMKFEGCISHMLYWSNKEMRSLPTEGFVANMKFDSETGKGAGTLSLAYTEDNGARHAFHNLKIVCRKLEVTIPTVVVAGEVFCETLVPVIKNEKFFVTVNAYSGSTKSGLHGNISGKLINLETKKVVKKMTCADQIF